MPAPSDTPRSILVLLAPHFNISATTSFIDPFRVANYLAGSQRFQWRFHSEQGGAIPASMGAEFMTRAMTEIDGRIPDIVLVSTSWAPERLFDRPIGSLLSRWVRGGALVGGLDTGAFVLARAGLLNGRKATVHYEHIDALKEVGPKIEVLEDIMAFDGPVFTCAGGTAATDLGLRLVGHFAGPGLANAAARYLIHPDVRSDTASQNPSGPEPLGFTTSSLVRRAINLMEAHLEMPLSIPEIAQALDLSQRQLGRLFRRDAGKSPVEYYRDIRLDRARGLVTQTDLKLSEVAAASGFNSQVHFSRAYSQKFGLTPSADRVEGRVPFEFRAWPMHQADLSVGTPAWRPARP